MNLFANVNCILMLLPNFDQSMRQFYFTPGPSQLYFTVEEHIKSALKENIPSISHRSDSFKDIFRSTSLVLRQLLNLPQNYHILFTASADRKSTRLNSSHTVISYAVFCLKKKKNKKNEKKQTKKQRLTCGQIITCKRTNQSQQPQKHS